MTGGANEAGTRRRHGIAVVSPGSPLLNAEALDAGLEQLAGQEGVVLRMGLEVQPLRHQQFLGLMEGHSIVPGSQPLGGIALQVSKGLRVSLQGLLGGGLGRPCAGLLGLR